MKLWHNSEEGQLSSSLFVRVYIGVVTYEAMTP